MDATERLEAVRHQQAKTWGELTDNLNQQSHLRVMVREWQEKLVKGAACLAQCQARLERLGAREVELRAATAGSDERYRETLLAERAKVAAELAKLTEALGISA